MKPNDRIDGWFQYHRASLASSTDRWTVGKRRDPQGQSGKFIGHTLDARLGYWLVPQRARLEVGASALWAVTLLSRRLASLKQKTPILATFRRRYISDPSEFQLGINSRTFFLRQI